jgi:hypothetical protein
MFPLLAVIHYALLAVTLAACLYLFVSLKRDLHRFESRSLRKNENLRQRLTEIGEELETIRREIEFIEQAASPGTLTARTLGSSTRLQAIRMIRHGEGSEHISAALNLPRNEVELLMKIQKLMADQPVPFTSCWFARSARNAGTAPTSTDRHPPSP